MPNDRENVMTALGPTHTVSPRLGNAPLRVGFRPRVKRSQLHLLFVALQISRWECTVSMSVTVAGRVRVSTPSEAMRQSSRVLEVT